MSKNIENIKGDYLILLVGTNPIPNYLASIYFIKDYGTIYLLCTESENNGFIGTKEIAKNMKEILHRENSNIKIKLILCHKGNGHIIQNKIEKDVIQDILKEKNDDIKVIHLNYTGGTKAMSSYTYNCIKSFQKKDEDEGSKFEFIYSYVDSELKKVIYRSSKGGSLSIGKDELIQYKDVCTKDILELHGYKVESYSNIKKEDEFEIIQNISINDFNINYSWEFKYIIRYGFDFCFVREPLREKGIDYKYDLFELKDIATIMCGDYAKIAIKAEVTDEDKTQLYKDLGDVYNNSKVSTVRILGKSENIETLKEWMRGN